MRNVVVYGASSAIAQEAIKHFAKDGDRLVLVARNEEKVRAVADDAAARGAVEVIPIAQDLDELEAAEGLWERVSEALSGHVDIVLVAHGILGEQARAEASYVEAERVLRTNFLSVVALLTPAANHLQEQGNGTIVVLSSVAGDRGRQSNYVYGASKGAKSIFLQGLRNRLFKHGVRVVTVKPGFVSTPMTAHLEQGPLFADPKDVGRGVYKASLGGPDEVYLPAWWRGVMGAVKAIPEPVFKRLSL